ncbi:MAG: FAD-dependent oxidoreductase [Lachnospiraceae bacterium]|nr:FAD-dependent oxidoreductase [Lachnospiraceae bacterium]
MVRVDQIKISIDASEEALLKKLSKTLRVKTADIQKIDILRRSIDARDKGNILYVYNIAAELSFDEDIIIKKNKNVSKYDPRIFEIKKSSLQGSRPIIVGAGPAGLFAAYSLCMAGCPPILIERGRPVEKRLLDVKNFWETGVLDPTSNVQFGEGGAGTFSDGKLNTLIKDRDGSMRFVLETFVKLGAPTDILYDFKPHIGTDVLTNVIQAMRQKLIRLGCEIRFETTLTDIIIEDNRIKGVELDGAEQLSCDALILAIGHSARDTFKMLYDSGVPMEAKEFAVGLRIEHPRSFIDEHQFGAKGAKLLGAGPYKLATKLPNGRGVYSFCMCPGGYVVNSSSEENHLVVNGMSYSRRDGENSNSAIVVSVGSDEYDMSDPLSGIEFQRKLEAKAFKLGAGKIPQQLYADFVHLKASSSYGSFSSLNKGGAAFADLNPLFSNAMRDSFVSGMYEFDKKMKGFAREDAILSGVESRTSSPVRIPRDDTFQSAIWGLYPCGEGAGYAGGITSAAMDGLKVAAAVAKSSKS